MAPTGVDRLTVRFSVAAGTIDANRDSGIVTVTALALGEKGVSVSWWVGPVALALLACGVAPLWLERRRRITA